MHLGGICVYNNWDFRYKLNRIFMSEMISNKYHERGQPEVTLTSDQGFRQQVEMDIAEQWKFEANMRDMGYDIARSVAANEPELLAYLDAMYRDDTYYGIASLMGIDVKKVMRLEKRLLGLLARN